MMDKHELIIYEGAMCCPTGICGPEPDKDLIVFNETLKKLQDEYDGRLTIIRASLVFNSLAFSANGEIRQLVKENGPGILPITTMNGRIVAKQKYLQYSDLKSHLEEKIGHD